jgi:hypothetical protein
MTRSPRPAVSRGRAAVRSSNRSELPSPRVARSPVIGDAPGGRSGYPSGAWDSAPAARQ